MSALADWAAVHADTVINVCVIVLAVGLAGVLIGGLRIAYSRVLDAPLADPDLMAVANAADCGREYLP